MTDPRDDELATAILDGDPNDDAMERLANDPAFAARVEELRAVRAAIAQPVSPDPHRRDASIAAAVATLPVDLAGYRRRRALRVAAIAAAAVAVAGLVGTIAIATRDRGHSVASTAGATTSDGASATAAGGAVVDFGTFADRAGLLGALRSQLSAAAASDRAAQPAPPRSPTPEISAASGGSLPCFRRPDAIVAGRATLAGQPVIVFVFRDLSGTTVIEVDDPSCTTLFSQPL